MLMNNECLCINHCCTAVLGDKKKSKLPNNLTRGRKNKKCGALVFSRAAQADLSLIKEQGMGFNNIYWSDDMF